VRPATARSSQHDCLGPTTKPRQNARAEPQPAGGDHLERKPGPDPAGQQRGGEQRQVAQQEAEAGAKRPATQHDHDPDRFEADTAGAERAKCCCDGREDAEHGDPASVQSTIGHFGDDQQQQQREE
jgi:hypothetical protein